MRAIKAKLSQGSLFGMDTVEQQQTPQFVATNVNRQSDENDEMNSFEDKEPTLQEVVADYSVHRADEYDQYPDFPGVKLGQYV
jgi:hypothetical protein